MLSKVITIPLDQLPIPTILIPLVQIQKYLADNTIPTSLTTNAACTSIAPIPKLTQMLFSAKHKNTWNKLLKIIKTGSPPKQSIQFHLSNGGFYNISFQHNVGMLCLMLQDVTGYAKRVINADHLFTAAINLMPELIIISAANGNILKGNHAFADFFGIDPHAIENQIPSFEDYNSTVNTILTTHEAITRTITIPDQTGNAVSFVVNHAALVPSKNSTPVYITTFSDISEITDHTKNILTQLFHDINNPLGAIITMENEGFLRNKEMLNDDLIKELLFHTRQIFNTATTYMKMSSLENNNLLPNEDKFNLNLLLKEILQGTERKLTKDKIDLTFKNTCVNNTICTDRVILSTILLNILNNAIKYAGTGGKIVVTIHENTSSKELPEYTFEISDNGPGIPEEIQPHMFKKYTPSHHGRKGNGIGLAFCKSVLPLLNGEISFTTNTKTMHPDAPTGTTFRVTIQVPVIQATQYATTELSRNILLINTQPDAVDQLLQGLGHSVTTKNPTENIQKIIQEKLPELIIIDMQATGALHLAIAIRESGYTAPIIAITTNDPNKIFNNLKHYAENLFTDFIDNSDDLTPHEWQIKIQKVFPRKKPKSDN